MMRGRAAGVAVLAAVLAITVPATNAGASPAKPAAPGGGITLHGVWTLVVHDRTGKVVARRHFENSLTDQGAADLVYLLGRTAIVGRWAVGLLAAPVGYGNCTGSGIDCWMSTEKDWGDISFAKGGTFKTLTVAPQSATSTASTPPNGSVTELTLAGNVTMNQTTTITRVDSYLLLCNASGSTATCGTTNSSFPDTFSTHGLATSLAVESGQQVSITLNFTFS